MTGDSRSDWLVEIRKLLGETEGSEAAIHEGRPGGVSDSRRLSGSYYTPKDVVRYFWRELFRVAGLNNLEAAIAFVRRYSFVEPAVGSGALFFGLLERLTEKGMSPQEICRIDIDLIDIDQAPLNFISERVKFLEEEFDVKFENVRFRCKDYRSVSYPKGDKALMFFGNPPFVTKANGGQGWKNLFGDFVERSIKFAGEDGIFQFIIPISLAFSRDYKVLRRLLLLGNRRVYLSNFDNIPDTLFRVENGQVDNLGHVNSQRCSVMISIPSERREVFSTELRRWTRAERAEVLGSSPAYVDVSRYVFNDQIPRPANPTIMGYLEEAALAFRLKDLTSSGGRHVLRVASVARNFIGIREEGSENVNLMEFAAEEDFLAVLWIVSSDVFFDYWRTVGDGFHVTRANLEQFPVHDDILRHVVREVETARALWRDRRRYAKSKLNAGMDVRSFDFSAAAPSLYAILGQHRAGGQG